MSLHSRCLAAVLAWAAVAAWAAPAMQPVVERVELRAGAGVPELVCPPRAVPRRLGATPSPAARVPAEEELGDAAPAARTPAAHSPWMPRKAPGQPLQVAIWGDSHLAAGFFTEELVRILGLPPRDARPGLLPAAWGRAGVRLPLRRSCLVGEWKHEAAYVHPDAADWPGPGLVSIVSQAPGAELAFDLRSADAAPDVRQVRLLYARAPRTLNIAVAVDDGEEAVVRLDGGNRPGVLEIAADRPFSSVRVRVLEGQLRAHGLELVPVQAPLLRLDVFGYPGATAAGWAKAHRDYLAAWFAQTDYDIVALQFGTNEGNATPFDPEAYRQMLQLAVENLKGVFPQARCVLIGPGDRGAPARAGSRAARVDKQGLLRYSVVHEQIVGIQEEVASAAGCESWNAFDVMGGRGSAYRWARMALPRMSSDLTHFTVTGYHHLAREFAGAAGWDAKRIWGSVPAPRHR